MIEPAIASCEKLLALGLFADMEPRNILCNFPPPSHFLQASQDAKGQLYDAFDNAISNILST